VKAIYCGIRIPPPARGRIFLLLVNKHYSSCWHRAWCGQNEAQGRKQYY